MKAYVPKISASPLKDSGEKAGKILDDFAKTFEDNALPKTKATQDLLDKLKPEESKAASYLKKVI